VVAGAAPERAIAAVRLWPFGKAQRLLAELAALGMQEEVLTACAPVDPDGPLTDSQGIVLQPTRPVSELPKK